jgi:hypothetical protein
VSGTVSYSASGSVATFTPAAALSYNTTYTATITTGATSSAGLTLAANYAWTFTTTPPDSLALTLSSGTVTVPAGGSIGLVTVNVARINSTGSIDLTVSGLPSEAAINYDEQPGLGDTGVIALNPETAAEGTYALTISATDGVATATIPLSFVINAGTTSQLASPINWSSTGPLISAVPDSTHPLIAVKDPSAFYYNNQWNIYATSVDSSGNYNMVYLNFTNWDTAAAAKPYYMDATPGFSGYHCAPEVFYFTPTNTWYMVFQSPQPQYSTTTDPTNPASWSTPQNFFASTPASAPSTWIDFFVVCDTANCYLFFSGDNGTFYSSQTTLASFPQGFSEPVIVYQTANNQDFFESAKVYALQGLNQYLLIVEAANPSWVRYYRSFIAPSLAGPFTPIPDANSWADPFAGENNVTFTSGTAWTDDISHGELLRVGYDQTLTINPTDLQFLYQGDNPAANAPSYTYIPWQLGLLTRIN